jgi:hypothetical protein
MKTRRATILFVMSILVSAFLTTTAFAQQVDVELKVDKTNGFANPSPPNPGESWNNAYKFLQDAIDRADFLADQGEVVEIWVANGRHYPDEDADNPNGSGDQNASFKMLDNVRILGGFAGNESSASERDPDANQTFLSGDLNKNDDVDVTYNPLTITFNGYEDNSLTVVKADGVDDKRCSTASSCAAAPVAEAGSVLAQSAAPSRVLSTARFKRTKAAPTSPVWEVAYT